MILIKQTTPWGCGVAALSMILEVTPEDIVQRLGHDGSDIIFPDEPVRKQRGFHMQELIDVAVSYGYGLMLVYAVPLTSEKANQDLSECHQVFNSEYTEKRLMAYMAGSKGIIVGYESPGKTHAWAYDGEYAYDPSKCKKVDFWYEDHGITVQEYYFLTDLRNQIYIPEKKNFLVDS